MQGGSRNQRVNYRTRPLAGKLAPQVGDVVIDRKYALGEVVLYMAHPSCQAICRNLIAPGSMKDPFAQFAKGKNAEKCPSGFKVLEEGDHSCVWPSFG